MIHDHMFFWFATMRAQLLSIFFFLLLLCFHSSFASSKLERGSSISVEDGSEEFLTSPDKTFTCGFYRVGTNAYCFSIWFTNSADKAVVWMANRDRPVNGRGSKLSLERDGAMVLLDVDGSRVWATNTSDANVEKAELRNTGNLVLEDPQGKILWQSFDSPTDTLLPSQLITKRKKLISRKGNQTYYTGYFSFFFNEDNVLRLLYDGPEISSLYWPNPDYTVYQNGRTNYNSTRIGVFDDMGRFRSSDELEFNASDMGYGIKRRLSMDYDGNLRLYSLSKSGNWQVSWQALPRQCDVHGLCGRNGICVYSPSAKCSCPPGYEMSDPFDWNKGCKPKFKRRCNQPVKLVELPQTDFYGFDLDYLKGVSFEECRKICMGNCSCEGFGYKITGEGQCYPKSALFNGYKSPAFPGSMYLKLPQNLEASMDPAGFIPICKLVETEAPNGSSNMYAAAQRTKWAYIYWFVLGVGMIELFFFTSGWWFLFRKKGGVPESVENGYRAISNQFRKFTYAELKKATKNFKEELGRGGSGAVYKGILVDKRMVAVKKLSDVIQGEEEFWAEVSTLGRINHMNLARMWGFCSEKNHKLLVYEYMENGSLDSHLFPNVNSNSNSNRGFLGWKERFKIALGAAKGLAYLHHECLEWVIHCDVKPENILLDLEFEAKIADFGLAKLCQRGGRNASEFSHIRGTKGYMAPEWTMNLPITAKVDVYSFGIVLVEIARGIRLSSLVVGNGDETELTRFIRETKRKIECGEDSWVEDIMDPRLNGKFNRKQAAMMVEVGISCVEDDRIKGPNMDSVLQSLLYVEDEREG